MRQLSIALLLLVAACRIERANSGRPPGPPTEADSLARVESDSMSRADVEAALRLYYDRMSARDWRGVRRSFLPAGTITTRVTPQGERTSRIVVQPIDDFVRRAPDGPGKLAVFSERIVHLHVTSYGDVADAWVVYEGRMGTRRDSVLTVRGVDAFHLYRDDGSWRIVDLMFTPEQSSRPLAAPRRPARRAPAARSPSTSPRDAR